MRPQSKRILILQQVALVWFT